MKELENNYVGKQTKYAVKNIDTGTLIAELNARGYSVYTIPTELPEEPEDGFETFYVGMKVDGRVSVIVNAPIGDFEAAKKAAEIEFSSSGVYDCGVVEVIDNYVVNVEDCDGRFLT